MMRISVLMAIYNEPLEWIRDSIESILKQTDGDFEFIILNDNPERTENDLILSHYSNEDKRIRIIKNTKNLGLTRSLNIAFKNSKGEYITRMDADDISLPKRFERQIKFMEDNPDCDYCGTDALIFSNEKIEGVRKTPKNNEELTDVLLSFNPICHPSVMIRRKSIQDDILYDEECLKSQDYELWLRFLVEGKKYLGIAEPLIKYRISDQQISTKQVKVQAEFASLSKKKALKAYLKKINYTGSYYYKNFVDDVLDCICKKRQVDYIDRNFIFYLIMSKKKKIYDTLKLVTKSIFIFKLDPKRVVIIFLSAFSSRYNLYSLSKEINQICKQ